MPTQLPADVADRLEGLRAVGDQWIARCPTHPDDTPSLTVKATADGKVLVHCHAGCEPLSILAALGVAPSTSGEWTPRGHAVSVYEYRDEAGRLLFQVLRTADKQFPQRRPDPGAASGWRWSLGEVRRVPYRLPELIAAVAAGEVVYIAEGEKDVDTLVHYGKAATCNPGGAGKWRSEYASLFTEAKVIIVADKDRPGQAHARAVAATLDGIAAQVWIVEAADPHKDITGHLSAGLKLSDVVITHRPTERITPDLAPDIVDILAAGDPEYAWLVEGLLERGDRVVLTGTEGLGKSMWLRMFAVCFAAGIHPFRFTHGRPLRVLMLDCENSERQSRRTFRPMVEQAARNGMPIQPGALRLIHKPNGVNLPDADDAAWLLERVTAHQPDVLILGPLYRLHLDNPNDETTARRVVAALDAARNAVDCAVLIEAHAGHGEWGKNRSVRPVGSSLYLRWPEFGYGIREDIVEKARLEQLGTGGINNYVQVLAWRGARDEREWPYLLRRADNGWPWEPCDRSIQNQLVAS